MSILWGCSAMTVTVTTPAICICATCACLTGSTGRTWSVSSIWTAPLRASRSPSCVSCGDDIPSLDAIMQAVVHRRAASAKGRGTGKNSRSPAGVQRQLRAQLCHARDGSAPGGVVRSVAGRRNSGGLNARTPVAACAGTMTAALQRVTFLTASASSRARAGAPLAATRSIRRRWERRQGDQCGGQIENRECAPGPGSESVSSQRSSRKHSVSTRPRTQRFLLFGDGPSYVGDDGGVIEGVALGHGALRGVRRRPGSEIRPHGRTPQAPPIAAPRAWRTKGRAGWRLLVGDDGPPMGCDSRRRSVLGEPRHRPLDRVAFQERRPGAAECGMSRGRRRQIALV